MTRYWRINAKCFIFGSALLASVALANGGIWLNGDEVSGAYNVVDNICPEDEEDGTIHVIKLDIEQAETNVCRNQDMEVDGHLVSPSWRRVQKALPNNHPPVPYNINDTALP